MEFRGTIVGHLSSIICRRSLVVGHLSSTICHRSSVGGQLSVEQQSPSNCPSTFSLSTTSRRSFVTSRNGRRSLGIRSSVVESDPCTLNHTRKSSSALSRPSHWLVGSGIPSKCSYDSGHFGTEWSKVSGHDFCGQTQGNVRFNFKFGAILHTAYVSEIKICNNIIAERSQLVCEWK